MAVSAFMNKTLQERWRVDKRKCRYIETVHNTPGEEMPDTRLRLPGKRKTVLTVGRTDPNKNPATWLKVAREVTASYPDVCFQWVGGGPELAGLQELTGSSGRIRFEGFTADPAQFYQNAYLYFQPSLMESHGIAAVEAMRSGLPCVLSHAGGLKENVIDGYNGILVDPLDENGCAAAIKHLLDDVALAAVYGRHSRSRYLELFSYKVFKHRMDTVYHRSNG